MKLFTKVLGVVTLGMIAVGIQAMTYEEYQAQNPTVGERFQRNLAAGQGRLRANIQRGKEAVNQWFQARLDNPSLESAGEMEGNPMYQAQPITREDAQNLKASFMNMRARKPMNLEDYGWTSRDISSPLNQRTMTPRVVPVAMAKLSPVTISPEDYLKRVEEKRTVNESAPYLASRWASKARQQATAAKDYVIGSSFPKEISFTEGMTEEEFAALNQPNILERTGKNIKELANAGYKKAGEQTEAFKKWTAAKKEQAENWIEKQKKIRALEQMNPQEATETTWGRTTHAVKNWFARQKERAEDWWNREKKIRALEQMNPEETNLEETKEEVIS